MKLRDHFQAITNELTSIKKDLAEHMRRTELLEKQLAPLVKIYHFLQVSAFLAGIGAAVAGIARLFF